MALIQNGWLPGSPGRILGASVLLNLRISGGTLHIPVFGGYSPRAGIPAGYRPPASFVEPLKNDGVSSFTTRAEATSTADASTRELRGATADGVALTSANASTRELRGATANGASSSTSSAKTVEKAEAVLNIGAVPSATDIAQAVVGGVSIEGALNLRQLVRAMAAVLLGESTSGNTTFKAAGNDAVTRVTGTVDGSGNRTSVTLTPGD